MSTNYNLTQFGFTSSTIFIIHYSLKLQTRSMAAAYAALVSLFNDLEDIKNHPRHSFFFDKNQIQSLLESVTFLIEFMESYDNCHGPSKDAAQLLERRITFAARAAEEVIESHVVEQIRGGSTLDGKKRSPRFLLDLEKVIQDMDYVRRKSIKVQQARIGLQVRQPAYSTPASSSTVPLTSQKTTMVGFDDVLLQLLDQLTGHPSTRRVIPIVGTGGVGKTTLAQNAFKSPLIVQHFDVCLWVTISQQYVVRDILLTLLSRRGESTTETVGELGEQLHKSLYGRRYLIVLDDIWSVRAWDEMMSLFPDTGNGSRIVVTTRQSNVANYIGSSPLAVSLLGDDESWDLFCEKIFAREDCPRELKDVGKNIVRKCKGLPLAIVVVAGHLGKSSRTQECWENIANNMKSVLNSEENEQLFNILSFSYIHLPINLKPCFVYLGTYAEDELIRVSDLIRRWIAEGFVKSCNTENLEEIAEDYLKDLIDRNLILDSTQEEGYSCCKIHDVLRELCLKVAEKEMFFNVVDGGRVICRERGVAIKEKKREENDDPQVIYTPRSVPLVRSLPKWRTSDELSFDLRLCRLLFADDKVDEGFREDLQHVNLRYLKYNERSTHISYSYFPSSISLFWNLQTLIVDIGGNSSSVIAPNEIWEMVQLRHLYVFRGIHLPSPLPSDKLVEANELVMRNLHTLLIVKNFTMSEEICKRVPNIKNLRVEYYDEVRSYYCPHNLVLLRKLESLDLIIFDDDSGWREYGVSLTFPNSLKELTLIGCRLDWEEMTMMIGSLPHLEILYLGYNSVIGSEWSLVEGKFLRLKSLTIFKCNDLVKWNVDSSHFPVLEDLDLWDVCRLDEFPSEIGAIPTLRSISLSACSVSLAISAVRMLVEQEEDHGNEGLRLHVRFLSNEEKVKSFNKKMEEEGLTPNNLYLNGRQWHK